MRVYLLTHRDGAVTILRVKPHATAEQVMAKWHPSMREGITDVKEITEDDVPKDYTFRDAWVPGNPAKPVEVNLEKAKELWRERIRRARKRRLDALDIEFIRAEETNDEAKKTEVVTKKQALRDIPQDPRIEAAKDPDELKTIWHPELEPLEIIAPIPRERPSNEEPKAPKEEKK